MAVNTTEIGNVYTDLLAKMLEKYNDMWDRNEIDAETYAKLVAQASTQLVQLSAELVQKQEQLDKDLDVKERSMAIQENEAADKLLTTAKQRTLLDEEKETSDKQQLLLDIQNEVETYKKETLLVDEHNINLKKIESVSKDIDVKERSAVVQETEMADKLLTTIDQRKLLEAQEKEAYTNRIIKDKEAVKAGLDNIHKTVSTTPEDVYTPKYETI